MSDEMRDAVFRTLGDEERPSTLTDWAVQERASLWAELEDARRSAINGRWSMRCDDLVGRLVMVSRFVGPQPWESVGISLLEDGTWQRFHELAEIDVVAPDMDRVAEVRRRIDESLASL